MQSYKDAIREFNARGQFHWIARKVMKFDAVFHAICTVAKQWKRWLTHAPTDCFWVSDADVCVAIVASRLDRASPHGIRKNLRKTLRIGDLTLHNCYANFHSLSDQILKIQ
jgi:hypothetical protein